jgi:RecB family exonuclease
MIPKSLSASAIQVAELCPARYKAEWIDRARGFGQTAATLGSTVHNSLELFVKECFIEKTSEPNMKLLLDLFHLSYVQLYNTHDTETEEYADGQQMLGNWFGRTSFDGVNVISCEVKDNFLVPTSAGDIPFNYVWDRFDQIRPGVYKVVDYKTNRWNVSSADLQKKIQARAYGLAAAIQLKARGIEYDTIWVEFDMLRHERVGRVFTYEDNVATWNYIKESAEDLIKTPDDQVEERLNDQCLFCVRKSSCKALQKNIDVGGIYSHKTIEELIDIRAQVEWQKKGLDALVKDLDSHILTQAKKLDMEDFESDMNKLMIRASGRRSVDAERVEKVIGPQLFERYGSQSITLDSVNKLMKSDQLTPQQKVELKGMIYMKYGEPRVKIETKNPIDD